MPYIKTVLGNIPAEDLGYCQCHEHLFISKGKSYEINDVLLIDQLPLSVQELMKYKEAGGNSIVDAQPVGCNRGTRELIDLSRYSNINIIASTGFHKMIYYPDDHWIFSASQNALAEIFITELTSGMYVECDTAYPSDQCDAKAGIIKTAIDKEGMTPQYAGLFSAAAAASLQTQSPILVHVESGSDPMLVFDFLKGLGVSSQHMIFCHLDRSVCDLGVHEQLCRRGCFLEYDTIGRYKYHSDEKEIEIIGHMTNKGYAGQLLLSLDTTRKRLQSYGGDIGLCFILNTFIGLMTSHGISEHIIQQMMVDNASKVLSTQ